MRRLCSLALCALLLASCRRETSGQTGVLVSLLTRGPCDCITLSEASADGGAALLQSIDQSSGLPAAFTTAGWREARLAALVYSGGTLGDGSITIIAEGHRGSCKGPVVARAPGKTATVGTGSIRRGGAGGAGLSRARRSSTRQ